MERFVTNAVTTLNGSINASQTSLVVTSASAFPASGTFSLAIDNEIMTVTSVSGTTFTVTRGQEGSTGASHSNGATVVQALTKRTLEAIRGEFVTTGAKASFTQQRSGRLYLPNNSGAILIDNGSAIVPFGRAIDKLHRPVPGDFSWTNQGTASLSTSNGFFRLSDVASIGDSLAIQEKNIPATPYSALVCFDASMILADFLQVGLCLRESGTGKIRTFGIDSTGAGAYLASNNWTNVTTFSSTAFAYLFREVMGGADIKWFKIRLDGTNVELYAGTRRNNTYLIETRAKNYHFTTAPNKIGMYVNVVNASYGAVGSFYSWEEGT